MRWKIYIIPDLNRHERESLAETPARPKAIANNFVYIKWIKYN